MTLKHTLITTTVGHYYWSGTMKTM